MTAMKARDAEMAAYHEAGHAVIAHMLGVKVRQVSIDEHGNRTQIGGFGRGEDRIERAIIVNLAGPYAQRRHAPRSRWRHGNHFGSNSGADFDNVTDLIFNLHGNNKVSEAYWRYVEARAEALVEQHWKKIDAVAQVLLRKHLITGDLHECFPSSRRAG
jgi:hypothetical protein